MYITRNFHNCADGVAVGVQALVPLVTTGGQPVSSRIQDTFGSVALADISYDWIAFAMLTEFQRSKMEALHYLRPLHHSQDDEPRFLTGWKLKPVSFREYFETIYAADVAARFWLDRAEGSHGTEEETNALVQYQLWSSRLEEGKRRLAESDELTALGRHFVALLPNGPLIDVARDVKTFAQFTDLDVHLSARLQNLWSSDAVMQELASAWAEGSPPPATIALDSQVRHRETMRGWRCRRWLGIRKYADVEWFSSIVNDPNYLALLDPNATELDAMLVDGRLATVAERSIKQIIDRRDDEEVWVRLALTLAQESSLPAFAFLRFPEVVFQLHRVICDAGSPCPDPVELASWIAPALILCDETAFRRALQNEQ
jgi:hypothetical protein